MFLKCKDSGNATRSCYRGESTPPFIFINTISIFYLVLSHLRTLSKKLASTWQVKKKEKKKGHERGNVGGGESTQCLGPGRAPTSQSSQTRIFDPILKTAQLATTDALLATACQRQRTMVGHWTYKQKNELLETSQLGYTCTTLR